LLAGATLAVSKLAIRVRKHGAPHGEWLLPVVGRDPTLPCSLAGIVDIRHIKSNPMQRMWITVIT